MASNLLAGADYSQFDDEDCEACEGTGKCEFFANGHDPGCPYDCIKGDCAACCGTGIHDYQEPEQPGDFD